MGPCACTPDVYLGSWNPASNDRADASTDAASAPEPPANDAIDANMPDAEPMTMPTPSSPECSQLAQIPQCNLGGGIVLPEDKTAEPADVVQYFAKGAALPSGRYELAYVDGCGKYEVNDAIPPEYIPGWTVHATQADIVTGSGACWLVGDANALVALAPGSIGIGVGAGTFPFSAFETYDQCVAANCTSAAFDFDFAGGVLGVRLGIGLLFTYTSGDTAGGRNPTFRLSRLDPCR